MKITIKAYEGTFSWKSENAEDVSLQDLIPQIKGLLVAAGYHPKNVDDSFSPDAYEWFPEEKESMIVSQEDDDWNYQDAYNPENRDCPPGMVKAPKLDQGDHDCVPEGEVLPKGAAEEINKQAKEFTSFRTPIPEEVEFKGQKIWMSGAPKDKSDDWYYK